MKLPAPSFLKKKGALDYYLALLLRDEKVTSVIFSQDNQTLNLVTSHEELFELPIDKTPDEELLEIFDKAVSIAESKIPEKAKLEKTIFCVKETWVNEGKIKKEYLIKLKKICDELALSPIGFLVFSEAIAHLLQQEEGAPVSGIFAQIGKRNTTISLVRGGKIIETNTASKETYNAAQTVDLLLRNFTNYEVLPARIILQNDSNVENHQSENEELGQEFTKHSWSKSLPFLHVPQVTILPIGFDKKAVLVGAASQLGFKPNTEELHHVSHIDPHPQDTIEFQNENKSIENTDIQSENFGFATGKDVALESKKEIPIIEKTTIDHSPLELPQENEYAAIEEQEVEKNEKQPLPTQGMLLFSKIVNTIKTIHMTKLLSFTSSSSTGQKKLIFLALTIVFIVIGLILFYFLGIKTSILISIKPKQIGVNQTITFSTNTSNDFSNNLIAAQNISTSEQANVTENATGKKNVGQKAKGSITIYNGTSDSKQYDSNTVVTSSNGLKYTLDSSVTIASASGDVISGTKSGTGTVNITASDIGSDFNLPSGTQFTVDGESTSQVEANNSSALSGGSKKTVTVVSNTDIQNALSQLEKNSETQAKNDMSKKLSSDQSILANLSVDSITNKTTSKTAGSVANNFTASGTIIYKTVAYKKEDLSSYIAHLLQQKVSSNETIDQQSIQNNMGNVTSGNNGLTVDDKVTANDLPKIDINVLRSQLAGKSFASAEQIIDALPQVTGSTITLSPNIPFIPKLVSFKKGNIIITTQNE